MNIEPRTLNSFKVSVIICAYTMDRYNDTVEAVESVLAQTLKPQEIILSIDHNEELHHRFSEVYGDRCSQPPNSERRSHLEPPIKVVLNHNERGLSETRNAGVRSALGDVVAFIDDDAVAAKTWLENLSHHFDDPHVMAVGGRIVPQWTDGQCPRWFPEEFYWTLGCTYKGLPINGKEVRNVLGCNMGFRKSIFDTVGYFRTDIGGLNETPRGGEEADLCLKIKQKLPDCLILYEPSALVFHKVPASRCRLSYIVKRSYNDGFYKRIVEKSCVSAETKALSTENAFLRYLLLTAIPKRFRSFYHKGSLPQAGVIAACTAAAGLGYLKGTITRD